MLQRVIEGTWEEIARQAGKLPGKRFRLTVVADEAPEAPTFDASFYVTAAPEEFRRAFDALGRGKESLPVLPPEAFERESLYADGEEGP